jgi:hypothetical protein
MKKRSTKGRALFYTRDSGGQHENTPGEYVRWAALRARELGLSFGGTPEMIEAMIRGGASRDGDLFLDYGVSGNVLSRDGLNALLCEAASDLTVSHVLIPRRDRLARPDHPVDGVKLEYSLRERGITLVFMDRVCLPVPAGQRPDIGELISTIVDYDKSGKDRRELAQKILYAQLGLASLGYSVGGRPRYGFRRWLAREDGTAVRQLHDGERVRMARHHVVWLPGPEEELAVIRRILEMLETMPASRVAAQLTREGVPTPDHGRLRTDRGVKHLTSGVWHQSVVVGIARNPLVAALVAYGRRSMGDQLRFGAQGPRPLEEADYRPDGKPKVVHNPDTGLVVTPAPVAFEPIIDPERRLKLLGVLDQRAGTQRGKPRSREPGKNPLGTRVFDMNCTWPMYRGRYKGSFRYTCGLYQQTDAQKCDHNHIDGPAAVRFVLGCIRQRLLAPGLLKKLEARLAQIAIAELADDRPAKEIRSKQDALAGVKVQLEKVSRNMALADTPDQRTATAVVFEELRGQLQKLEAELQILEKASPRPTDPQAEVAKAMALVRRLADLGQDEENYAAIGEVFAGVNARLFLRFAKVEQGKRKLNRAAGGVVTFGNAPPPIAMYTGPTARVKVKGPAGVSAGPGGHEPHVPPEPIDPGREGDSLGNVCRGDWIRTSDLLNPIQEAWSVNSSENTSLSRLAAF